MRKLIILLFCMLSLSADMMAGKVLQNVYARKTTSLNGEWQTIVDPFDAGYYDYRMNESKYGFFKDQKPQSKGDHVEYDFSAQETLKVPGDWNTQRPELLFYEGSVWYKKTFKYNLKKDRLLYLYFGGANYQTDVYLNGEKLGTHIGGFTPFHFDITDKVKKGENFIVVRVNNVRHAEGVPTVNSDWWNYGGITRDVMLVETPMAHIDDYDIRLQKGSYEKVLVRARINIPVAGVKIEVHIPELSIYEKMTTNGSGVAQILLNAEPKLWSPDHPKLYNVELSCEGEGMIDQIGFRHIETNGKKILLNGKQIFLRGISIHEEKPFGGGRANCTEDAHTLLSWAKELGCNFVRLAHYPHNEYAIREAERMGMLVWSEIPCYWTIAWSNKDTYANAQRQLTDMIRRDQNRANVIIWSIANETPHSAQRDQFLGNLAQYARSLDSTRLISMAMEVTGASNYKNRLQDNMNKYVDVVSFNQYIGWYRDVNDAPKMEWEIPYDKPVIVSEFGGGAKYGLHGAKNQRWTEEFQENLYIENLAMLEKIDGLAGMTPWILKDFRSPRRVLDGIQDYYNRKGVVSDKGEKKKAFFVLKQWYDKR